MAMYAPLLCNHHRKVLSVSNVNCVLHVYRLYVTGVYELCHIGHNITSNRRDSKYYCSNLGNRLLHNLTSARTQSLRIDMEDFEGNTRYAVYSNFAVGSEADGFNLTVSGYSGTAGSCL